MPRLLWLLWIKRNGLKITFTNLFLSQLIETYIKSYWLLITFAFVALLFSLNYLPFLASFNAISMTKESWSHNPICWLRQASQTRDWSWYEERETDSPNVFLSSWLIPEVLQLEFNSFGMSPFFYSQAVINLPSVTLVRIFKNFL